MAGRRPEERGVRRSTRLVLALGILAGMSTLVAMPVADPRQVMLASDVYLAAGEAVLSGEDLYAVRSAGYPFIYPPAVALLFVPHALLGSSLAAFAIQTALNLVAGVGTALVITRALDRRGVALARLDRALLVAFVLGSAYGVVHFINGQVTLWLGFAFAVGFDALDRDREKLAGIAFAGAALVKVFPAAIGLWLLRRRAWRAVGVAVATGLAGLLVGLLALGPDPTMTYFTEVLPGRHEGHTFDGPPDPGENTGGSRRQIAALLGLGPPVVALVALAVLVPLVLSLYRRIDTDERRQAAALGTVAGTLLFLPLQPLYFPLLTFPLLVLVYRLPSGTPRSVLLAGTLLSFARAGYDTVALWVGQAPLPAGAEDAILGVAERILTVILPPTLGLWLMLIACVLVHYRGERGSAESEPGV